MHGRGRRLKAARGKTLMSIVAVLALALAALASGVVANASGSAPTAVTEPTNPVGFTTATFKGTVNPHGGEVTECTFRVRDDACTRTQRRLLLLCPVTA